MSDSQVGMPLGIKIWNLIFALEFLAFSIFLLVFNEIIAENVELILSLNLVMFGILKLSNILIHNLYNKKLIIVDILIGIIGIGGGVYLLLQLTAVFSVFMIVLAIVFMAQGIYRFFNGILNSKLSRWGAFFNSIVGLILILLSIVVYFYKEESGLILNIIIAAVFIVLAIGRVGLTLRGYVKK